MRLRVRDSYRRRSPPVDRESVKIYTRPPTDFEEIAIVKAGSDAGWTQQDSVNYALAELKKQAAKLGANGVIITSSVTQTGVVGTPVYGGGTFVVPTETEVLQGVAIYVGPE